MLRRTITLVAAILSGTLVLATGVRADVPLNRAVVESLRNRVQFLRQNQTPRPARVADVLTPGQGVSTARASLAELRFNDGSLGRLGEQAVFWFTPAGRDFRLSNGTVLMLIPPGQGRTNIRTPNATAGIQGSALFVRYIAETDTTIVGALTDSGIAITNRDGSQQQVLEGGQMAVAVGDRIERIYDFDLNSFYQTSELVRGLAPTSAPEAVTPEAITPEDAGMMQVQEEMQAAIDQQASMQFENAMETPGFVRISNTPTPETSQEDGFPNVPAFDNEPARDATPPGLRDGMPMQPGLQTPEPQVDQIIVDPRRDDQRSPASGRPGNGAGRPDPERPGNGVGRPDPERPGNGVGRPDPERPGNGVGRPDPERPGNGAGRPDPERPGNGAGRPDPERPGNGAGRPDPERPGNGAGRPDPERPGNGAGRPDPERPGNGAGRPDPERPGNGVGQPDPDRPGNGQPDPDRPGNSNGNGQPDPDRPGNGVGRDGDPPGNANGRNNDDGDRPGNANGQNDDRPGNGVGRDGNPPGNAIGRNDDDRPGNANGQNNGDDRPGNANGQNDDRPGNGVGQDGNPPGNAIGRNDDDRPGNANGQNDDRPGNGVGRDGNPPGNAIGRNDSDPPGNANGRGNGNGNRQIN